ncbi:MAG: extracellular solute-binding protein [Hyphomicrobiales bacterium]|nr:extracellular solute-binding protein [Hyphomicrobiales bacterium]
MMHPNMHRSVHAFAFAGAAAFAFLVFLSVAASSAHAQDAWKHGDSLIGTPKYEEGFEHFDYVNPDAPKTGSVTFSAVGSFDSLNPFILKGNPAAGLGFIYDTLMTSAYDEPSSQYGLIAEAMSFPSDYSSVIFRLREDARFPDGESIQAEDIAWSFDTLRDNVPLYHDYYADVEGYEILSPREIRFNFSQENNRELPYIMGQLVVLPKHYWKSDGRVFDQTSLDPPMGSGAYRVGEVQPGRFITYERIDDYWGKDLPVNRGKNNFKTIRIEYFLDREVALQAFLSGTYDWRIENTAKSWATGYESPALENGDIIKRKFSQGNVARMQGFVFNTRRGKFSDPRVRHAFDLAFDFEWTNRTLFYGQYERLHSYFDNSELASRGIPEGLELEILERFREDLPEQLFTTPYETPVTDGSGNIRNNLRKARALLSDAGWEIKDGSLTHTQSGEIMEVEILLIQPNFERILLPYKKNLERLGISLSLRIVDSSQYLNRRQAFDFDMIVSGFAQSLSPGNEQRDFWSSEAADREGSRNFIGIKNPTVDALVEEIIFAKDREHLVAATRALDRTLLWQHYIVPNWHSPKERVAYWKHLGHPEQLPAFSLGFPNIWWHRGE